MKKLFFLSGVLSIFSSMNIFSAALYEGDLNQRWKQCADAIARDNVADFKKNFVSDFLTKHFFEECGTSLPTMRPISLANLAARSKLHNSTQILEEMIGAGLDPNFTTDVPFQEYEMNVRNNVIRWIGWTGHVRNVLLLDEAARAGNVPAVKILLKKGANPYQTSIYRTTSGLRRFLKEHVSSRIGESPLDHAQEYLQAADRGQQTPGTAQEYREIIKLLEAAQVQDDIDKIGRCSVQ